MEDDEVIDPDWEDFDVESDHSPDTPVRKKKRCNNKSTNNKEYCKTWRKNMTLEQRQKYNEGCKLRMRKMRSAKKAREALTPRSKLTIAEINKRRKRWREEKRRQRAMVNPVQKRVKEIKALEKRLKKLTPREFSELVDTATTPRKTKYMSERGMYYSPHSRKKNLKVQAAVNCFTAKVQELKQKTDKKNLIRRRIIVSHMAKRLKLSKVRSMLGVRWHTWKKYSAIESEFEQIRKERNDKLDSSIEQIVEKFYKEKSSPIPSKRFADKAVLSDTTKTLHNQFLSISPSNKVGLTKFKALRPKRVLTADHNKFVGCVCEYCINLSYQVNYKRNMITYVEYFGTNLKPFHFASI